MSGLPSIVVTADDYGLHEDINRGIRACVEEGLVDRVSIAGFGEACSSEEIDALKASIGKSPRKITTGIHLGATEGHAIAGSSSLTDENLFFRRHIENFLAPLFLGLIKLTDLKTEWRLQAQRIFDSGIQPEYLNSHQHVHILPGAWDVARYVASEFGLKDIRCGYEPIRFFRPARHRLMYLPCAMLGGYRYLASDTPRITVGLFTSTVFSVNSVRASLEYVLERGLDAEVMVHPGYPSESLDRKFGYWQAAWQREIEELKVLRAVLDEKTYLAAY